MNISEDTIAAVGSAVGGAVAIVRVSGRNSAGIAAEVWKGTKDLSRDNAGRLMPGYSRIDGSRRERAMCVYMPAPNSYTGEDVVEIQCHGGALVTGKVLESILDAGARQAEPGEFTLRAFLNGKMDLTQAEAVADIVNAHSSMALHVAERQAEGVFGNRISAIRDSLVSVLAECESRLDFPEEDLDWKSPDELAARTTECLGYIRKLLKNRTEGAVLRNGIRIVIAGRPNSGKSSLLNLILGYDRAIVTTVPGTTRDTLEEFTSIRNIPVRLIDTAGIREADNLIEGMGVERSFTSMKQAQLILWLLDASQNNKEELKIMRKHLDSGKNAVAVWNKTDISPVPPLETGFPTLGISVETRDGIEGLFDEIERAVWEYPHTEEPDTAVSIRHGKLLDQADKALRDLDELIENKEWELAAVPLRDAVVALGTITGEDANPDILEEIFSRFCIGK